ncbi:MAG: alpha/beta hydrolase [Pseudomonadales bacterium]|nr:alpha/beta hydrolase [Pseudomonadales bacterium]
MHRFLIIFPTALTIFWIAGTLAADAVPLYETPPNTTQWIGPERSYFSEIFRTDVVTNVSTPTITPFLPQSEKANGIGIVIAPGGGFHALSINSEGNHVAKWLNDRGVAAFVLRYRLVPSGEDGVQEMMSKSPEESHNAMSKIAPLAGADGLRAIALVREQAANFRVDPDRIGFMGFSAGGAVTVHVAYLGVDQTAPAFVAPIYAANRWLADTALPENLPPAFIVAASDDPLGLAIDSVNLYTRWLTAKVPAELHMYANGGHGFGMRHQNLPSDTWIERFGDWLDNWAAKTP